MSTKAKWENGIQRFYESASLETVQPMAAVRFYEEFLGKELLATETGSKGIWDTVEVNLNTAIGLAADEANGAASLALDADNNAEDAVLYFGDQRPFNLKNGLVFEAAVKVSVLPTTGVCLVMGMAGDHNLVKDSITEAAWFRLDASGALKVETDDTTNNNDDVATGITLTAGQLCILRIDFTDLEDVKFYVDGERVASGTTFDMSNLSDAEAMMQPYFSLDKGASTSVGTLLVDAVRIWSKRS